MSHPGPDVGGFQAPDVEPEASARKVKETKTVSNTFPEIAKIKMFTNTK